MTSSKQLKMCMQTTTERQQKIWGWGKSLRVQKEPWRPSPDKRLQEDKWRYKEWPAWNSFTAIEFGGLFLLPCFSPVLMRSNSCQQDHSDEAELQSGQEVGRGLDQGDFMARHKHDCGWAGDQYFCDKHPSRTKGPSLSLSRALETVEMEERPKVRLIKTIRAC